MSRYDDIITMPHHTSAERPHMTLTERAAQFAPFAALTGFDGEIAEAARLTDGRLELSEDALAELDERLRVLRAALPERPEITLTVFVPDMRKAGGAYVRMTGRARSIDEILRTLTLEDGRAVSLDDILSLDVEIFDKNTPLQE